jgi:hypothetical protein
MAEPPTKVLICPARLLASFTNNSEEITRLSKISFLRSLVHLLSAIPAPAKCTIVSMPSKARSSIFLLAKSQL